MPRAGLNRETIINAALLLVDESGPRSLTIQNLARLLKVRPPSLYNFIDSLETIQNDISARANIELTLEIQKAIHGKTGKDALIDFGLAYREYALTFPGRYFFSTLFPKSRTKEWTENYWKLRCEFLSALSFYGLSEEATKHAGRSLRSFLHGFVAMEMEGGWATATNKNAFLRSFEYMLRGFEKVKKEL